MYDCIIVGGGTAGLMAAVAAAEQQKKVLLIEKGKKLGQKLAISGGGRCNVTNRLPIEEIIKNIPGNGRFLYGPFSIYNNKDLIQFFESNGVALKEEDHGRMFPVSNRAQDVVNVLLHALERQNVTIKLQTPVTKLIMNEERVLGVRTTQGDFLAHSVIIAVGGKAVPHTGSTGDGYAWAERAGHTITTLFPTEVPLVSQESFIQNKELQGLALRDVNVSVLNKKGKAIITHKMDMLFTHFGVSGPAILRCSQFVVKEQMKTQQPVTLAIQTLDMNTHEATQLLQKLTKDAPKRAIKNTLKGLVPERWLLFLLQQASIDGNKNGADLSHLQIQALAVSLTHFTMLVHDTLPMEKAFVTGGGISTKEIEPKTMASRKKQGLYFCGEILDIHGYTGGYNITAALVTGRIAGMSAVSNL